MAIKRRNKINPNFSMSSMTDIIFLLLIFFMVTSTLVHPNALKLLLPRSDSQTSAKPFTTVSVTQDLQYFVEDKKVIFSQIERELVSRINENPEMYVSLHVDRRVSTGEMVKVMNIMQRNQFKVILATQSN